MNIHIYMYSIRTKMNGNFKLKFYCLLQLKKQQKHPIPTLSPLLLPITIIKTNIRFGDKDANLNKWSKIHTIEPWFKYIFTFYWLCLFCVDFDWNERTNERTNEKRIRCCVHRDITQVYVRYADVPISILQPLHCYRP